MKNVPLKSQTQRNIKTNQHQTSKFPSKQKYLKCTHVQCLNAMHRKKKKTLIDRKKNNSLTSTP